MDAGGPRTAAAEQGHAAAHSCGSLRGHACGGGADPQYQRQTAGATVDAPTAARRVAHARRLVPTPAHAAKVHKPAWASTQKRGQLPMRWSSESGKKTCSQVDASTEAGFMHSYVVGHIGPDPSQPSILRNGDRGRRESSRQVPVRLIRLIGAQPQVFYHRVNVTCFIATSASVCPSLLLVTCCSASGTSWHAPPTWLLQDQGLLHC